MRPPHLRPPLLRPPLLRPAFLAAILIALLAAAAPAAAAPRLHGIPERVRSGAELRITWTGLGREAHEAELELALAGGHWVRISPELEARAGGFTWRVPSGLAGPARLRLRYGGEGYEVESDVSVSFVLQASAVATHASDAGLGEWWCLDRLPASLPPSQVTGAASLHMKEPTLALSPEPERVTRIVASFAGHVPVRSAASSAREPIARRDHVSRSYPLRI